MDIILKKLLNNPKTAELYEAVRSRRLPVYATGLCDGFKLFFTKLIAENGRVILLVPDGGEAERLHDLFAVLFDPESILTVPERDLRLHNYENVSHKEEQARVCALLRLLRGDYKLALLPVGALLAPVPAPQAFAASLLTVKRGETLPSESLLATLLQNGYKNAELTEYPGQFSHRGGIFEFFPPSSTYPVRLEYFGDEVDSLSHYDPQSQRRVQDLEQAILCPVRDLPVTPEALLKMRAFTEDALQKAEPGSEQAQALSYDVESFEREAFTAFDRFLPLLCPPGPTPADYDPDAFLVCFDFKRVKEAAQSFSFRLNEDLTTAAERGTPLYPGAFLNEPQTLISLCADRGLILLEDFLRQENDLKFLLVRDLAVTSLGAPGSDTALLDEIEFMRKTSDVFLFAGSSARATYLPTLLGERGIPAYQTEKGGGAAGAVGIIGKGLPCGFSDKAAGLAVIASTRVSGQKKKRSRFARGEKINDFADIHVGDYIVHSQYGIGIYDGVHKVESQGVTRDFIRLRYAGTDALFIPAGQFDMISKYVAASDDVKVKLNKLGSGDWARARARVKAGVRDIAKDLIALYSARQSLPGYAFSPDSDWQQQFESAFEFEETEDQRITTAEIKADMEKSVPMDRLLCGDVGFGKTEVALRAAFKCVLDGKQAAMLTPTTVLAWQHYNTMLRRFEGFPVTVELLSRFRSPAETALILRRLARGEIDIVVGTHKLLGKDVKFKDLGLLIVDEEQRFGVTHKEALKNLAKNVDVLTLSATPIPRTLNMALSGIRDMSVLETPPADRHPVSTYVLEYDQSLILDALRRELARGGQVYYLHNRIDSIYKRANSLAEALPGARVEVAHGAMAKEELSEIWDRMTRGEIDVLVCTTIIETGVDVPNANTLVIEEADRLGLAQLHQIRGRVGRSYQHAYAYFTYRPGRVLTEDGRKRLDAIREYTEFGSGFKIAMRDLQIRGAGDLLGADQHGHMDTVGYEMYMQLLNEAINEERGIEPELRGSDCLIDLKVSACIPESYIDSSLARIDIYKKIAAIRSEEDVSDIVDELIERFGDPPREVLHLMDISLIREQCRRAGVKDLTEKNGKLILHLTRYDVARIAELISAFEGRMVFSAGSEPSLSLTLQGTVLDEAIRIGRVLSETKEEEA